MCHPHAFNKLFVRGLFIGKETICKEIIMIVFFLYNLEKDIFGSIKKKISIQHIKKSVIKCAFDN